MAKKIIDLSLTLKTGARGYERERVKTIEKDGWNASTLHIYSHAGTHMDAPVHFNISKETIDELDPGKFVTTCLLVDIPEPEESMFITPDHLRGFPYEDLSGKSIVFRTGWSQYADKPEIYRDKLPKIGEELAIFLVKKGVSVVGVEPPSVADVNNSNELTKIHDILMRGGITIIEGLANLDKLSGKPFTLVALPLKIEKGDGAPARVIAIEE